MRRFLDWAEDRIMNLSRRLIVLLTVLVIATTVLMFLDSVRKISDGPDTTVYSSYDAPSFVVPETNEKPDPEAVSEETVPEKEASKADEKPHPYAEEIESMVDDLFPLFKAFDKVRLDYRVNGDFWEQTYVNRYQGELVNNIRMPTCCWKGDAQLREFLTVDMTDWLDAYSKADGHAYHFTSTYVPGAVEYIHQWSEFYQNYFEVEKEIERQITAKMEGLSEDSKFPRKTMPEAFKRDMVFHPLNEYANNSVAEIEKLNKEAKVAAEESTANNVAGIAQLTTTGYVAMGIIILVFLLLIFKVEIALRRQADLMESDKEERV